MDDGPAKDGDMDSHGQPALHLKKQNCVNTQNTFMYRWWKEKTNGQSI